MEREKAIKILQECREIVQNVNEKLGYKSEITLKRLANLVGIEPDLIIQAFCVLANEGELDISQMELLVTTEQF